MLKVEIYSNQSLRNLLIMMLVFFGLFVVSFWDSKQEFAALLLASGSMVVFFTAYPYLMSSIDWRDAMDEEAEALMHSSRNLNRNLRLVLALLLLLVLSVVEFGVLNVVTNGLSGWDIFVGIFTDGLSLCLPMLCAFLFTQSTVEVGQMIGYIPFLSMVFFSTTFSLGSGMPGLKGLRYLFPRYYLWCIVPGVEDAMEGCPENRAINAILMVLTSLVGLLVFLVFKAFSLSRKRKQKNKLLERQQCSEMKSKVDTLRSTIILGDKDGTTSTADGSTSSNDSLPDEIP